MIDARTWARWAWEFHHPGVPPLPTMIHGVEAYERRLARETSRRRMCRGMGRGPLPRP